ncbi:DUF3237 domain-containing protein [Paraburkholderia sp. CNPSo 3274]|uniref:DUF3237 family protein n=1 Tax=Paraburkholderia sp. CNPSo 3274 TaxID=2940932 RepID=UPI0020B70583|nr:DUF3237 family protein [Paraburkholderia sp. CNPSo 3274]MCP3711852.1 DUF3237 domain-containing protein [Paraburkholderia sp. CNPSo 3274]
MTTMSTPRFDELPPALQAVQTRPLFVMRLDVKPIEIVGQTGAGLRRVGIVPSGTFAGERLSGVVLDGGSDWQSVHGDGSTFRVVRSTAFSKCSEPRVSPQPYLTPRRYAAAAP